jgi:hypothetical protein
MFYDCVVNSVQVAEQARRLLDDWKKEHEGYYAHNAIRIPYGARYQFEASCGYRDIPGGGSWLTSGNNLHAITVDGTVTRITYAGRRHGMRAEFRDLLEAASLWCDYRTLSYQTEEPSWAPWETRDDQRVEANV